MNYIKFLLRYKKYSKKIVPDIRSRLFEQSKSTRSGIHISSVQMRRIAAVSVCFIIVLSAVFVVYYSGSNGAVNTDVSSQHPGLWQGDDSSELGLIIPEDLKPRKGATKEEAEQTTLTTEKSVYIFNEIISFTVKPLYENDVIGFGENYYVQYYDVNTKEWTRCPKDYPVTDNYYYFFGKGPYTKSFTLSERVDNVADKYRLAYDIWVNEYKVNIVSNEFTIVWRTEHTTLTTNKTEYKKNEEILYTITAQNVSDRINLANTYVQCYDSTYSGWKVCEDLEPEKVTYSTGYGSMTAGYGIHRIGSRAEKYRLCSVAKVNDVDVTLISNEFTVDWENSATPGDSLSKPREGATLEEAKQTTLTTDKTSYAYNEEIRFKIQAPYQDDLIDYSLCFDIQYYNDNAGKWVISPKNFRDAILDGYIRGAYTKSIQLSTYTDVIADKYRLVYKAKINVFDVELVSNEFTVKGLIDEKELYKVFESAGSIYEWIYGLESPPYANRGDQFTLDGIKYEQLDIYAVNSKNDFKNYLRAYYSDRIANKLVDKIVNGRNELFIEKDGKLYCIGGYVGQKFYTVKVMEIVRMERSDNKIVFTLKITAVRDHDQKEYKVQHNYVYEKLSDGHWVFTDFELPYYLIQAEAEK